MMRTRVRRVAVLLVSLLAIGELVLRIDQYRPLRRRARPLIYTPDPESGFRFVPGAHGDLCIPGICKTVEINSLGYIGREFPKRRTPGARRLLVVATSDATGFYTSSGESYVTLLGRDLATALPGVEVLNFSIDGAGRDAQNAVRATNAALEYAPDLVLLQTYLPMSSSPCTRSTYRGYVLNYRAGSSEAFAAATREIDGLEQSSVFTTAYSWSFLLRALTLYYFRKSTSDAAQLARIFVDKRYEADCPQVRLGLEQSVETLRRMRAQLAAGGTALTLLVTDPASRKASVAYGFDAIRMRYPQGAAFHDGHESHLNERGQEALADQLRADVLKRLEMTANNTLRGL
jgi:hypothetical protein